MTELQVITASAGSGKTYRLVELVTETLLDPTSGVRPEGLVAVTYTRKAADELVSRLRTRLVQAGRRDLAGRLRDGRLGTLHSVCAGLVQRYALELGLPPTMAALSDAEARRLAREALEDALVAADPVFEQAAARLSQEDWRGTVDAVLARARVNGVDEAGLRRCGVESTAGFRRAFAGDAWRADRWGRLAELLDEVLEPLEEAADTSKAARARYDSALAARRRLEREGSLPWAEQVSLGKRLGLKAMRSTYPELFEVLEDHAVAEELFLDVDTFVGGVFGMAAQASSALEERKRAARLLDFDDMLTHGLALVDRPGVAAALADELDLVVVDEFQDVSPLQLAVVGRLIAIAGRGAWVGDEKQAIYSFQGADPELVRAEIDQLPAGQDPETLSRSFRSRPALVRFCSDLFVAGLERHGFSEERVRLEPARPEDPELVDVPVLERWTWRQEQRTLEDGTRQRASEGAAVADGVQRLLAEGDPVVPKGETCRGVQARDVAVLCRTNVQAARVASALRAHGLAAVLRSPGLLATEEAQLLRAAVALVMDGRDGVAAVTVAWLGDLVDDPDKWLGGRLQEMASYRVRSEAASLAGKARPAEPLPFDHLAPLRELREARGSLVRLSPTALLPRLVEILELDQWCLRAADPGTHLGNLEALFALAEEYETSCHARRTPVSLAGFLESLRRVEEDEQGGSQAVSASADAVTVTTYHASKGLEWPVVVLASLDDGPRDRVFGLHVERPMELDIRDPLAGRWLRLWPWPYGEQSTGVALADRAQGTPEARHVREHEERERARLLYVGFTRARDRLVLSTAKRRGAWSCAWLDVLQTVEGQTALELDDDALIAGDRRYPCLTRGVEPWPIEPQPSTERERTWFARPAVLPSFEPASKRPSDAQATPATLGRVLRIGPAREVGLPYEIRGLLGDAYHRFVASDASDQAHEDRCERARRLIEGFGVWERGLDAAFCSMTSALYTLLDRTFPEAAWMTEWPVWRRLENGQRAWGEVDLLGECDEGLVIIDHKVFAGTEEGRDAAMARYSGQLAAYASLCSQAFGRPVLGTWLHFPFRGELVEVLSTP